MSTGSSNDRPTTLERHRLLVIGVLLLLTGAASVAAALSDRWPGDLSGVRLLQGALNGFTEPLLDGVNFVGDDRFIITLTLGTMAWLLLQGKRGLAAMLGIVVAFEAVAVLLLKWAVHRPRPELPADLEVLADPSSYSFPSGHVALAVALFGALAYLVARHWSRRGWWRWTLLALLIGPAVLIGPARVAWGVHWPSDVLGGYLLALLGIQLLAWLHHQFEHNAPSTDVTHILDLTDAPFTPGQFPTPRKEAGT